MPTADALFHACVTRALAAFVSMCRDDMMRGQEIADERRMLDDASRARPRAAWVTGFKASHDDTLQL